MRPVRSRRAAWAKKIVDKWQQSVQCIIDVGALLSKAKEDLPHGAFEKMVDGDLPFGPRSARMLMQIAEHPVISNRKHASDLPASWATLYELTRVPEAPLRKAIARGEITAETKRKEVTALRDRIAHQETAKTSNRLGAEPESRDDLEGLVGQGRRFGTIYADPPWQYGNQGTRAATKGHYDSMSVAEIAELPVADLAGTNSHLHLWTTSSFLFEAREVLEAWGFEYRSSFVWVKPGLGIGNYWRVSHELLLLGVRGSVRFRDRGKRSWLERPRMLHSQKPEEVRKMIEKVSPGPYLELFARREAKGWTSWGNEVHASSEEGVGQGGQENS